MKTTVTVRVPYPADADAGDLVQIYSDFGSGTLDLSKPLLAAPVALFAGREKRSTGLGSRPIERGVFGTQKSTPRQTATFGNTIIDRTPFGSTPDFLEVDVLIPAAYGLWKFGAQIVDEEGNAQAGAPAERAAVVAGTQPPDVARIALASFDKAANKITFDLTLNAE